MTEHERTIAMIRRCALGQAECPPHFEACTPATRHDPDPVNTQTLHDVADHGIDGVDRIDRRGADDRLVPEPTPTAYA